MARRPDPHALVDRIERLIHVDVGRNITGLFDAARGALWGAASALARTRSARVGIITGFYVPQGFPPAAETDGPVGAALLAKGLEAVGIPCRVATDEPCRSACAAALVGAGIPDLPIDVVAIGAPLAPLIEIWQSASITHAISIERCGRSADGPPRNMRGQDIGSYTAALDDLFTAGPWDTIAIGDGGNEIGMGAISRSLIAGHVALQPTSLRQPDRQQPLRVGRVSVLALAVGHVAAEAIQRLARLEIYLRGGDDINLRFAERIGAGHYSPASMRRSTALCLRRPSSTAPRSTGCRA